MRAVRVTHLSQNRKYKTLWMQINMIFTRSRGSPQLKKSSFQASRRFGIIRLRRKHMAFMTAYIGDPGVYAYSYRAFKNQIRGFKYHWVHLIVGTFFCVLIKERNTRERDLVAFIPWNLASGENAAPYALWKYCNVQAGRRDETWYPGLSRKWRE